MYPDYSRSIVNLVASLSQAMGYKALYDPLPGLDTDYLAEKDTIIMINVDALGLNLIRGIGNNTILSENKRFDLTSIFPSTTACASVAYQTGMAAWNHALTGWFVNLKETGASSVILLDSPRFSRKDYQSQNIPIEGILNFESIFPKLDRKSYIVTNKSIVGTPVSNHLAGNAVTYGHKNLKEFVKNIRKVSKKKHKKFIYAYWSLLDHIQHKTGPDSSETEAHFNELCQAIELLQHKLRKENYIILISADHGMIKVEKDKEMGIENFPELPKMMNFPFSGEPRVPYCYIKPEMKEDFEKYVTEQMKDFCTLYSREEIIKTGWYGKGEENPRFSDRIGDYVLLMKDNYVLKDKVLGEKGVSFRGYHGGLSNDEMEIPLIIIDK